MGILMTDNEARQVNFNHFIIIADKDLEVYPSRENKAKGKVICNITLSLPKRSQTRCCVSSLP